MFQLFSFNMMLIYGIILLFLVVMMAIFKGLRIRMMETKELLVGGLSGGLFVLLFLQSWIYRMSSDPLYLFYEKLCIIPLNVTIIGGFLYYEGLITVKPAYSRLILMTIFVAGNTVLTILNVADVFLNSLVIHRIAVISTIWLFALFHVFAIWVYQRILKIYRVKPVFLDFLSLVCVGTASFIGGVMNLLDLLQISTFGHIIYDTLVSIAGVFIIAGIGILSVNNVKWGDYIYHIPIPVYAIMIYNSGGLLIYNRNLRTVEKKNVLNDKEVLISGALTAFSTFFKEILGSHANLSHIKADPYEFLFSSLPNDQGKIVIVTSGGNVFLTRALKKMTLLVSNHCKDIDSCDEVGHFEKIFDEYVMKSFPFAVLDKKEV